MRGVASTRHEDHWWSDLTPVEVVELDVSDVDELVGNADLRW
jgi:hypothetical protein